MVAVRPWSWLICPATFFGPICRRTCRERRVIQPMKPMSNGHFALMYSPLSTAVPSTLGPELLDVAREIDLSGIDDS